jgi:hypothetical protein
MRVDCSWFLGQIAVRSTRNTQKMGPNTIRLYIIYRPIKNSKRQTERGGVACRIECFKACHKLTLSVAETIQHRSGVHKH